MKKIIFACVLLTLLGCNGQSKTVLEAKVSIIVLGTVQDAGSPHIGCKKECCSFLFSNPDTTRKVVSLGLVDHEKEQTFLFEATPDITAQLKLLREYSKTANIVPNGIFLTHAHIGHYTGLMYLGREALGAKNAKVYAMPKMKAFLKKNGPWNQLVNLNNISTQELINEKEIKLTTNLKVIPFLVPHRDEFSETVGYKIIGPKKSLLFVPDIDKWSKWEKDIVEEIKKVDYAFLDATFFYGEELNNRSISEIPHPFIVESMELFKNLPESEKQKIHFIHFNHTNPVLDKESEQATMVLKQGFHIANFGQTIRL
ncbi:pyrroloquinoline quinone biosynthesis protein PqqB [Croceitalea sp. MTPC9]|uniref:MBL fold metallo-hydrolase n=1 Tax=unclassified Croceitalea TaxID=2632280 RepID=UPI002B377B1E|nr:pyrroloquinoline quinone biosynthesis protein PqqB [Croceitalea sp. MTPC6]GMN18098.1 pyrroloquinoline quinone biosynthesis protein PqqB [Croceitalea sp. MTPC9]